MSRQPQPPAWELYLRSGLFYVFFIAFTVVWSTVVIIVAPAMPYRRRFAFSIGIYCRVIENLLEAICRIRVEVAGRERIPAEPCIIYSKHQSTWETFYLQVLFAPQCQVIKRELLFIPFFGWAFTLLAPIAIDRSKGREAMAQVIEQGRERLKDGVWILIFPEGTRIEPGQRKPFHRGGATLAHNTGSALLPVAHNAGLYWPNRRFLKYPGTIRMVIGEPLTPAGLEVEELTARAEKWVNETSDALIPLETPLAEHSLVTK